ncbi:hypothetical protein J5Y09_05150 [Roseomonas sp. PWR1]|uniref:PH domain-containing protein n=1 Tax=Roseomonas nitratireducens TaxID=2820810 RepID=A0ABS4APY6_9PROT|nr:hypothetical protein [Neoroseomonas nitratireducens]MBP0463289.1 hypothetical protein [Neoroseomonas nitratireducens]
MATNAAQTALDIRNRIALVGWIFMATWFGMVMLFTWLMARDGPHPSQPAELQKGAIAIFWIIGLAAGGHVFSLPVTRFRVGADGTATLSSRTPFGRKVETFPAGSIRAVEVRADRDSDGDPYWRTVLVAKDGRERTIREGHHRPDQQEIAARLRAALPLAESPPAA